MISPIEVSDLTKAMDAFYRAYALAPGSTYQDEGDCEWYVSNIPFPVFGGAFNVRFDPVNAYQRVQDVRKAIRGSGAAFTDYAWLSLPGYHPDNFATTLSESGGERLVQLAGKAMALENLCDQDPRWAKVDVRPIETRQEARNYAEIYALLFEAPTEGWVEPLMRIEEEMFASGDELRRYLVWLDGRAVAAGMAMDVDGCAALQTMSTLPEGRNRGFGGALGWKMMFDLREAGCQRAVVWSSPGAQSLYERLGFRQVANADVFTL